MNAVELLESQHKEALALMKKLEASEPGAERKQTFRKLHAALIGHMAIEEEIFYPAVIASSKKDGEPIAEGYEEHVVARVALERCMRSLNHERLFQVRVGVLKELIEHHIKEERSSILPMARKALPKDELNDLGALMEAHFNEVETGTEVRADLDRKATARAQRALS
jgi:iron-sulfur cluster repair protein YtfE (RIC family)